MQIPVTEDSALILVDVQNDFCPGGALPVPDGDRVVSVLNEYLARFKKSRGLVVATRDWHPEHHISFKERGGPWPRHCVQRTPGSHFHLALSLPFDVEMVSKAMDPNCDAYSGFQGTGLERKLKLLGIRRVYVGGLATDYCVKYTVLDALNHGFETYLLADASRGVEVDRGDCERAVQEMLKKGAKRTEFADLQ